MDYFFLILLDLWAKVDVAPSSGPSFSAFLLRTISWLPFCTQELEFAPSTSAMQPPFHHRVMVFGLSQRNSPKLNTSQGCRLPSMSSLLSSKVHLNGTIVLIMVLQFVVCYHPSLYAKTSYSLILPHSPLLPNFTGLILPPYIRTTVLLPMFVICSSQAYGLKVASLSQLQESTTEIYAT